MNIGNVIDIIKETAPGKTWDNTVDTLKSGHLEDEVTGIVSTFMATISVIERTIKTGSNMIITHEPTYYNHMDDTVLLKDDDIFKYKKHLITENNISIFRFHDHWHLHQPDGILYGLVKQLEWTAFADAKNNCIYNIPEIELESLIGYLKGNLGIYPIRYVGPLSMKCRKIGILPGAYGGDMHMKFMINEDVDVFICGETAEWQTFEYIRDANSIGMKKAILVLGHANSEEIGMKYFVEWLKPKIPNIPIAFIPAGDPMSIL